jgi:polyferredoxin
LCAVCQAKTDKTRRANSESKLTGKVTRIASTYKVIRPLAAVLATTTICHACGAKSSEGKKMHVDHCHETNEIRGVLCFTCNVALGNVQDSIARLEKLISYLRATETVKKLKDLEKIKHFVDLLIELESKA